MTDELIPVHWDSEFLGYPVGKIVLSSGTASGLTTLVTLARDAGYRLLYLVAPPDSQASQAAALAQGATLVDRKVTYLQAVPALCTPLNEPDIVPVTQPSPALRSLALQSGEYSRFRLDANFAPQVYEDLYTQWIQNSLSGQLARTVLAYRLAGTEVGLLTLGVKGHRGDIGLLAVDAAARGAYIGQRMVTVAQQLTAQWGLPELQVVTQLDNELACRFYAKCGFYQEKVEYIYHLWLARA